MSTDDRDEEAFVARLAKLAIPGEIDLMSNTHPPLMLTRDTYHYTQTAVSPIETVMRP